MPRKKNPIQKAAIIDVETTGLSAGDEVVELTAILFSFNRDTGEKVEILDEYSGLREPGCAISSDCPKQTRFDVRCFAGTVSR